MTANFSHFFFHNIKHILQELSKELLLFTSKMPVDPLLVRSASAYLKKLESTPVIIDRVVPKVDSLTMAKADAAAKAEIEATAQATAEAQKIALLQIQAKALALIQAQADAQAQQLRQAEAAAAAAAKARADAEKKAHEEEVAIAKDKLKELAKFTSEMQTLADEAAKDYSKAQSDFQSFLSPEDSFQPVVAQLPVVAQPSPTAPTAPAVLPVKRRTFFSLCFWSSKSSQAKIPSETEVRITSLEKSLVEIKQEITVKVDQRLAVVENNVGSRLESLNTTMESLIAIVQANQQPQSIAGYGNNVSQKGHSSTKPKASVGDNIPHPTALASV